MDPFTMAAGIQVVSSVIGALTYKTPSQTYTAQEKEFMAQVDRYKGIREKRQAAITIAAGISGLPESTFYGRRGSNLMASTTVKVGETEASQTAKDSKADAYATRGAELTSAASAPEAPEPVKQAAATTGRQMTKASEMYGKANDAKPSYAEAMGGKSSEVNAATEELTRTRTQDELPQELKGYMQKRGMELRKTTSSQYVSPAIHR